jgi:hypothetical protein
MTEMKSFNNANVKLLRNEMEEAIRSVASKYGLKVSGLGNIGYNMNTMTTGKITLAIEDSQDDVMALSMTDLVGKRFKSGSRTFTLISIENGKFIARTNRGARYIIAQEQLSKMIQL